MLRSVLIASKNALSHLESFGGEFVSAKFNDTLESHHKTWIEQRYDWFISENEVKKHSNFLRKKRDFYHNSRKINQTFLNKWK